MSVELKFEPPDDHSTTVLVFTQLLFMANFSTSQKLRVESKGKSNNTFSGVGKLTVSHTVNC